MNRKYDVPPSHLDGMEHLEAVGRYNTFRDEMRRRGLDPDMIGSTEVKQPCCPGCGDPIPWALIHRYR